MRQAVADDPEERFRTTVELARACRRTLAARPAPALPPPEVVAPPTRRSRRKLLIVASAGLLVAAGAAAYLFATHRTTHTPRSAPAPRLSPAIPERTATAVGTTIAPIGPALSAFAAAAAVAPKPTVVFDRIARSGDGVRYRSTPNHWCGSSAGNPVPQSDPCWRDVLAGSGAAEGQRLRIYCYTPGAAVHGDTLWAKVSLRPVEYVPATFLAASGSGPLAGVPDC